MNAHVKEKPIIFSSEMVRAILENRKSQTRRIIKPQPAFMPQVLKYLYSPGDKLWVREKFAYEVNVCGQETGNIFYSEQENGKLPEGHKWRPSIHMPEWASRITLKVVDVRIERLQDISEEDAQAEGVLPAELNKEHDCLCISRGRKHTCAFISLWDSLYAKRGYGWEKNIFVWVVKFEWCK